MKENQKEQYAAPQTDVLKLAIKRPILNVSYPQSEIPDGNTGEDFDSWDN